MLNKRISRQKIKLQNGLSMVEVLVAIVIFSFGLLAIAGLQLSSMKYQKGAWSRAGAATVITDISERMQANVLAAREGSYLLAGTYISLKGSPPSASGCDSSSAICAATDIAKNDLADWFKNISSTLPGGVGTISGDKTKGFLTTVMWFDKNALDSSGNLVKGTECTSTPTTNCCPAGTPAGVRCVNAIVWP